MHFENSSDAFPNDGFKGADDYDGLRLEVLGEWGIRQYEPGEDEVCVSISSQNWGTINPPVSPRFVDVLRLHFDDISEGDVGNPDAKTITPAQASRLANFVKKHRDKKKIVIHCFAGRSRSRSTACAIADYLELPYSFTARNQSVWSAVMVAMTRAFHPAWQE